MEQHNSHSLGGPQRFSRWKRSVYAFLLAGALVLLSALVFLLFYADPFINTLLKNRIIEAFQEAYPSYSVRIGSMHYDIPENRIGFDSVALTATDSSLSCTIAEYSISGIGWLQLLLARGLVPNGFAGTVLDAHGIVVDFPRELYQLRCGLLHVSVPDSGLVIEDMKLHPLGDDEQFFLGSNSRRTRLRLVVPYAVVEGLACLELLQGRLYRTRSAHIHDALIDVLVNKDKPAARDTSRYPTPNKVLASIEEAVEVDSLDISNGGLRYGERFAPRSKPAVVTFDSMQVSVRGVDSHGDIGDTMAVRAKGKFMKSADVNIMMSIPVSSPEFSFHYSGSLARMKLTALNSFLDPAEQTRIKSGTLQLGLFDINVTAGHASGSVRAVYKDLTLAAINRRTGSEEGIFDVIASFVANNVKIRRNNIYGSSMKIGNVNYTRQRDDPFFRFAWFSLRSGVGDVVGF